MKRKLIVPQSKNREAIANRKKIPKRVCLANTPLRGQCNREFQPKYRFNFICPLCSNYFKSNNVGD